MGFFRHASSVPQEPFSANVKPRLQVSQQLGFAASSRVLESPLRAEALKLLGTGSLTLHLERTPFDASIQTYSAITEPFCGSLRYFSS